MSSEIRARVSRLIEPRKLIFEDDIFDADLLTSEEVAIATEFSAISPGTELAAYTGLPPLRPGNAYPRLVGYCNCGRVIAVGTAVKKFAVGDRVLTFAAHRSHERVKAAEIAAKVPSTLDGALASVTYLFHLGYAALQRVKIKKGQRVAVIGLGVLGMTTASIARLEGAHVIVLSRRKEIFAEAQKFGAHELVGMTDASVDEIGADIVVTTSNDWNDWVVALRAARRGGTIAVLGFPGRGLPPPTINPLDSQYFYSKQLNLVAVGQIVGTDPEAEMRLTRRNMQHLVELIAANRLPAKDLIGGIRPAAELADAYEDLSARRRGVLTYVLGW